MDDHSLSIADFLSAIPQKWLGKVGGKVDKPCAADIMP